MSKLITKREKQVLDTINNWFKTKRCYPSHREIQVACGYKSVSGADKAVYSLANLALLEIGERGQILYPKNDD